MEHWQCPYCGRHTTLNRDDIDCQWHRRNDGASDWPRLTTLVKRCPSPECRRFEIAVTVKHGPFRSPVDSRTGQTYTLEPPSIARHLHNSVPDAIVEDYNEACAIIDRSPKAAATLARRAVQGMVRDFWGVQDKKSLYDEIDAIRDKVEDEVYKAIDSVRKIGNIGAHMGKDVNTILNLDPEEARLLIELIELLAREWYLQRFERKAKLKEISERTQRLGARAEPRD